MAGPYNVTDTIMLAYSLCSRLTKHLYIQGVKNAWNPNFIFLVVRGTKDLVLYRVYTTGIQYYNFTYNSVPDVILLSLIRGVLRRMK